MPPRSHPTGDPLLKGSDWRKVRAYWWARREPCHACGGPIVYRVGYVGPRSLDVGHWPVSRDQAKAMGWTRQQTNAISNTRPECRACSRSDGARRATALRMGRVGPRAAPARPIEADEW